ncbi:Nitrilase family, member 2 [Seminavis robusta]|uniref:Nitrilase family, member 2 n=1 Tax=Seminavis robusta TaxID=568900 RepID=A0A9N8E670_9STRA|nr:Nitrilase family, member 2 [Seminavis robusta]|eukprot:Sro703_g190090.1 Nitrilase family, member 2 (390) ;mRNA; f:11362-12622
MDPKVKQLTDMAKEVKEKAHSSIGEDKFRALPPDFVPTEFSVICARGKRAYESKGNTWFRSLVAQYAHRYATASTKMEKSVVVTTIVDTVRKASPVGSFIRKVKGQWQEVSEGVARERVGQKLRDTIDADYRSSTHSKRRRRVCVAFGKREKSSSNNSSSESSNDTKPSAQSEGVIGKSDQHVEHSRLGFLDVAREARGILEPADVNMSAACDMPGLAGVSDALSNQLQQEAFGLADGFPEAQGVSSAGRNDCLTNAVRMFEQHPLIPQRTMETDVSNLQTTNSFAGNFQADQGRSVGPIIQDPFLPRMNNFAVGAQQFLSNSATGNADMGRSVGQMNQDPFLSGINNFHPVDNYRGLLNRNISVIGDEAADNADTNETLEDVFNFEEV